MDKAQAYAQALMHYPLFGIQVWVYLVLVVFPFVANEFVQRSKSTVAMSLFQLAMRGLLQFPAVGVALAALPGLGTMLHKMAGDSTGLPPTFAQRRAARSAKSGTIETKPADDAAITTTTTTEVKK